MYLIAFFVQFVLCAYVFIMIACAFCMGIGFYMVLALLIDDLEIHLNAINECAKSRKKRPRLEKQFLETIHLHSVVKQLSEIY